MRSRADYIDSLLGDDVYFYRTRWKSDVAARVVHHADVQAPPLRAAGVAIVFAAGLSESRADHR